MTTTLPAGNRAPQSGGAPGGASEAQPPGRCLLVGRRKGVPDAEGTLALRRALEASGWVVEERSTGPSAVAPQRGTAYDIAWVEDPGSLSSVEAGALRSEAFLVAATAGMEGLPSDCVALYDVVFCPAVVLAVPLRKQGRAAHCVAPGPRSAERRIRMLERHLRYRRHRFAQVDWARISYGHTVIGKDQISPAMVNAWKDEGIPERQRALVQNELQDMYQGRIPGNYQVLADALAPYMSPGLGVLEIGCASGYYYEILEYLLGMEIGYEGADFSDSLIRMAKSFYPGVPFHVADGADLPFADGAFPVAISSCVLLHVPNFKEHIRETVRVSGKVVVAHRTPICRKKPTQFQRKFAYGVETVELVFNEREILEAFESEGLRTVGALEFISQPAEDSYTVTYIFEKTNQAAHRKDSAKKDDTADSDDILDRAESAFQEGELAGARGLLDKVRNREPENPRLLNNLGALAYKEGDLDGAFAGFREAFTRRPDNRNYLLNLASVLMDQGKPDVTATWFQDYLARHPEDEEIASMLKELRAVTPADSPKPSDAVAGTIHGNDRGLSDKQAAYHRLVSDDNLILELMRNPELAGLTREDLKGRSQDKALQLILGEYYARVAAHAGRMASQILMRAQTDDGASELYDHRHLVLDPVGRLNDSWALSVGNVVEALPMGGRLLDLCAGDAFSDYHLFRHRASRIVCVDVKPEPYQLYRRLYQAPNIEYLLSDVLGYEPDMGVYDVVAIQGAIGSFSREDRQRICGKAKKALKPGGWFCGDVQAESGLANRRPAATMEGWKDEAEMRNELSREFAQVETRTVVSKDRNTLLWRCRKN